MDKISSGITVDTRGGLRRIRAAAVSGEITPEEMQQSAKELMDRYAKALLSINMKTLLKPRDQEQGSQTHVDELNEYVKNLLPNTKGLNLVGNPLDPTFPMMVCRVFAREGYAKKLETEKNDIYALLSTGAIALSVLSYVHEIPVYVAAVNEGRDRAVISSIKKSKENARIIDDVVGNQVNVVRNALIGKKQYENIRATDLNGN